MSAYHEPVLLHESVELLGVRPDGVYVDATFGGGGHSREILRRLGRRGRLVAFDQDAQALANAPDDPRLVLIHNNFRFLRGCLRAAGFERVDGLLADLGVSSHHFDTAERGFSFRFSGPLDMRMNQRGGARTAADIVNHYTVEQLARIFGQYGELERPYRVAQAVERRRAVAALRSTDELLEAVAEVTPRGGESKFRAKLFQALRIEVNGEMQALEMGLAQAARVLPAGGRLSVITYHSLEDRLVKNFIRAGNATGEVTKDFYGRARVPFKNLVPGGVVFPSAGEVGQNPRARSAKLRGGEKLQFDE